MGKLFGFSTPKLLTLNFMKSLRSFIFRDCIADFSFCSLDIRYTSSPIESVDGLLCRFELSLIWGVLIGVWAPDGLGLLAGVYSFFVEDLKRGPSLGR